MRVEGHRQYNPGWHLALDLRLDAHCRPRRSTRAAIERKESRGGHTRDDFPGTDAHFGKVNIVRGSPRTATITIGQEPLPEMPATSCERLFEED